MLAMTHKIIQWLQDNEAQLQDIDYADGCDHCDVNAVNSDGETALHAACDVGSIHELVAHGACVETENNDGAENNDDAASTTTVKKNRAANVCEPVATTRSRASGLSCAEQRFSSSTSCGTFSF